MIKDTEKEVTLNKGFWPRIRRYFIAGVLITAPISITLYLAWQFVAFMDKTVHAVIPAHYNPETYLPFSIPGLGLIIVFLFLTFLGALTAGFIGRLWLRFSEYILVRMPVIRSIYTALKQIFETVFSETGQSFKDAVLVEYPKKDMWVIGFLTGTTRGEVQRITNDRMVNVFIPTTPNPTSGFLVFVPHTNIIDLEMSVEEALKMIISAGIVVPEDIKQKALAQKQNASNAE